MKSKTVILTTLSVLFITIVFVPALDAQERTYEPVTFHEIAGNIYEIHGGAGAHGGLFIGQSEALLIDMKMNRESVEQVMLGIEDRTEKPVRWLINTHSDRDHVGGNRYIPDGVTIIAHENCRKEMLAPDRNGNPSDWNNPDIAQYLPSITFKNTMRLHLDTTLVELRYFGTGHTTGDIVVYFPHAKTAFLGDQVRFGRPQLIHSYKGGNSFGHVANLNKMLEALPDAEIFCSGHNDPAGRRDIERHIAQMEERQEKVRSLMNKGESIEQILAAFTEDESRLVRSIHSEIEAGIDTY